MKKDVLKLINQEKYRQETTINLIASENYVSKKILEAVGSILTNKYAEGYPQKRYYSGCQVIDEIENYAQELGKQVFGADHVNVQPHSGSQANMAVYFAELKPGDIVLGLGLESGGHLTHGHKVNFSGKLYNFIPYNVSPETEQLDYDEIEILTQQHKPKMIVAGASAYSRTIDFAQFARITEDYNAKLFVDMAHIAGLVAAGLHPSPIPVADFVSSTTHKTLRGPRGGMVCCKAEYAKSIDKTVMPGIQGGPLMHIISAKAIAFEEALTDNFKVYQKQVIKNAKTMCKTFQELGYHIVSGGTDTHLFLIDLRGPKASPEDRPTITGEEVETTLEKCNITLNRNCVPFDPETPMVASGIRIGTPAVTTRGFKEKEVEQVCHWIHEAIKFRKDEKVLARIKEKVISLCKKFPIYS